METALQPTQNYKYYIVENQSDVKEKYLDTSTTKPLFPRSWQMIPSAWRMGSSTARSRKNRAWNNSMLALCTCWAAQCCSFMCRHMVDNSSGVNKLFSPAGLNAVLSTCLTDIADRQSPSAVNKIRWTWWIKKIFCIRRLVCWKNKLLKITSNQTTDCTFACLWIHWYAQSGEGL